MSGNSKNKPKSRRRVRRSVRGSTRVSTVNLQESTYRVAGQIFSRTLFPNVEPKSIIPPTSVSDWHKRKPDDPYPFEPYVPDNLFNHSLTQLETSDYAMGLVNVSVWTPGIWQKPYLFEPKGYWRRKPKKISELITRNDGLFSFKPLHLKFDKRYRLIAAIKWRKKGIHAERVRITFKVRKRDARKMKQEFMNIRVKVDHQLGGPSGPSKTWVTFDRYEVNAKFFRPGSGQGVLWFGGEASVIFNTFILNVPWLSQHDDIPSKEELRITAYKRRWKLPVSSKFTCAATCITMILRYFGIKKLTVGQVMIEAAKAYLQDNQKKKNFGLPYESYKKNIIQLEPIDGIYPYCIKGYLVKAAKRIYKKKGIHSTKIHTFWRESCLFTETWENTLAMFGLGWPIMGVKALGEFGEGGEIQHAGVICGAFINRKGKVSFLYYNDPDSQILGKEHTFAIKPNVKWKFQIIVSRTLEQKDICPHSQRLLSGGEVPAPRRQLHPAAVL